MSTVLSAIAVMVVLIVVGLLLYAASRRKRTQLIAEAQVQAKHKAGEKERELESSDD